VGGLAVLWVGAYLCLKGELTIGQLIAFRIISGNVVGPIIRLAGTWQTVQGLQISVERLADVVDAPTEQHEDARPIALPPISGKVEFDRLSFRFRPHSPLVVKSVSFTVEPGKFVGIVGQSGSGKSTIMKLLPRLYDPTEGVIRIDDYDIAKVDIDSLRQQIGIVPQDSMLFDGSVRDNIDGALLDLSTFYRDILVLQSHGSEILNVDLEPEIANYARTTQPKRTLEQIDALLTARTNLSRNAAPLATLEALFCALK